MLAAGSGVIVNVASISAVVGMPGRAAYCATKAGVARPDAGARGRVGRARASVSMRWRLATSARRWSRTRWRRAARRRTSSPDRIAARPGRVARRRSPTHRLSRLTRGPICHRPDSGRRRRLSRLRRARPRDRCSHGELSVTVPRSKEEDGTAARARDDQLDLARHEDRPRGGHPQGEGRSASTPTTSSRTRSTSTDDTRAADQGDLRGGRAADPLRRLRRVRHRRLQPLGAALHARPDQGVRRPGRVPRRARTCCSSSASTTGTARSSRTQAIWDMAKEMVKEAGEYAQSKGLEIVLELEPFEQALLKDVDELVRFVGEIDHPAVRANADISHLHLSNASFEDVAKLKGLIGHIHLSDCDGKVHGDLPAGRGVTPIKEYLQAIVDTGYDGTVSIELEYSPDPEKIVEWAQRGLRRHGRGSWTSSASARRPAPRTTMATELNTGPNLPAEDRLRHRLHRRRLHHARRPSRRLPRGRVQPGRDRVAHAGACARRPRSRGDPDGLRHLAGAARRPRRSRSSTSRSRRTSSSRSSARRRSGRT